jgi:malate dehydrogenase (oxaloacetate-decarboxylating)
VPAGNIVACDSGGILYPGRGDIEVQSEAFADKWRICLESNAAGATGGIEQALAGADVCLAFSRPDADTIRPEWVRAMAPGAVVFACANPVPEIWPWDAAAAGARVVATGRGDFPNQVNNSLAFPAIFRGVLDVRARSISDGMAIAAAEELAAFARERGVRADSILPSMDEWEVYPRVATAVGLQARREGLAQLSPDRDALMARATQLIRNARESTDSLMRAGLIPAPPAGD